MLLRDDVTDDAANAVAVLSWFDVWSVVAIAASIGSSSLGSEYYHIPGPVLLAHCVPAASIVYTTSVGFVRNPIDADQCFWCLLFGIISAWIIVLWAVWSEYTVWILMLALSFFAAYTFGEWVFFINDTGARSAFMGFLIGVFSVSLLVWGEFLTENSASCEYKWNGLSYRSCQCTRGTICHTSC